MPASRLIPQLPRTEALSVLPHRIDYLLSPECEQPAYWDQVLGTWDRDRERLWRTFSDTVNRNLLDRWVCVSRDTSILKTDVFDEVVGEGVCTHLAARARQVVAIDISVAAVEAARLRHPAVEVVRADVRRLPFGKASFDAVVSLSTLDHFHTRGDIEAALRELHRALKPNGQLVLTLDNPGNPLIALRNSLPPTLLRRLGLVPYFVGATLGPRALCRALTRTGFEVRKLETTVHFPRALAVPLARALSSRPSRSQRRFLELLLAAERATAWPTRLVTGHFLAAEAVRVA